MPPRQRYYRKIIRIKGQDSPNVRLAMEEIARGLEPSGHMVVDGVLPWEDYQQRRATWDEQRQCVGLDAEFYQGAEILLYPPIWLDRAHRLHTPLRGKERRAKGIGIDTAEGGDRTSMSAVDELGLIAQVSKRTPDTSVIIGEAIAFMREHGCEPNRICFDRGGGGKEHADTLRSMGYKVRTVAFGESLALDPKRGIRKLEDKLENKEERYVYVNRRAEMYGELRILLNPANLPGFAIPVEYTELRRQLSPMPLLFDREGRMRMLPKNKNKPESEEKTLVQLLGCSPDEADSFVLAIHAMQYRPVRSTAGAIR